MDITVSQSGYSTMYYKMQQNILSYSEAKTARLFWWSSLDFWVVWAFSRLTTKKVLLFLLTI